ncbi:MAG TPA: cytochrome c oxidase subunit II [Opitutales bacterium]|nr:cytochrome c oxidase subunit II [Opitutales bacterium]
MSLWTPRNVHARRLGRRFLTGWVGLVTLTLLAGCAIKTPQSTLDVHGLVSRLQLHLFMITVWVCLFIFVTVGGTMAVVVWKYRERPGDENKPMPEQGHGNPLIEISLITASIALLVIIAVPTLKDIFLTNELPTEQPYWAPSLLGNYFTKAGGQVAEANKQEPLTIIVRGKQWWWIFEYPQFGFSTANELYMPAGRVVKFELRSDNVIHSFWLPKIAGKVDCMPGRANWMWMMADEDADTYEHGLYYGQCAQYCGESHAFMLFRARIVSDKDFAEWVRQSQQKVPAPAAGGDWGKFLAAVNPGPGKTPDAAMLTTDAEKGAALFFGRAKCVQCHTIDGSSAQGTKGPNLSRVASRTAIAAGWLDNLQDPLTSNEIDPVKQEENFYHWISKSYDVKPGNLMWYDTGGLRDIVKENEDNGTPITDQDWHYLAAFLMTLK